MDNRVRCAWLDGSEIYTAYHDNEWGKPVHDDNILFELLVLESFQAGLSWKTILTKRDAFRLAFDGFDPNTVALYKEEKIQELLANKGIVRHKGKIVAAINNAKAFLLIQKEYGSFDKFVWSYVDNKPIIGHYATLDEIPATTAISDKLSKDMKKRGFSFLGSTTVYAFMQASGIVNDHMVDCYLYNSSIAVADEV